MMVKLIFSPLKMSLPKSRILSTSKGFTASAELHSNSPEQNTVVNVNVNQPISDKQPQPPDEPEPAPSNEFNPYANVEGGEVAYPPPIQERSVETAKETTNELQALIRSKDNIINAFALMLDILEHNPLIINKYVVADLDSLTLLISYLTEADRVDIQESLDIDCSCSGHPKYVPIDKIYITKGNDTQNFKYQYPNANKILDDHHISVKFVVDRTLQ